MYVLADTASLEAYRIRAGITWRNLCTKAGLSQRVRPRLRAGQRVSVTTLAKIAKALKVDVAVITAGSGGAIRTAADAVAEPDRPTEIFAEEACK